MMFHHEMLCLKLCQYQDVSFVQVSLGATTAIVRGNFTFVTGTTIVVICLMNEIAAKSIVLSGDSDVITTNVCYFISITVVLTP